MNQKAEDLFDLASEYEYDARDYKNARKYYEEAINKYNHPLAAFNYGLWFLEGRYGTPKNDKKAREYFEKSAKQNVGLALMNLAAMYEEGKAGLPKNLEKAFHLLQLAKKKDAARLNGNFYTFLGRKFMLGSGVPKNYYKALKYYKKAQQMGERMPTPDWIQGLQLMYDMNERQQRENDMRWNRMTEHIQGKEPKTNQEGVALLKRFGFGVDNTLPKDLLSKPFNIEQLQEAAGGFVMLENYEMQNAPKAKKKCGKCGKTVPKMKQCSQCMELYCSKECQTADWPNHKSFCKKFAELTAI